MKGYRNEMLNQKKEAIERHIKTHSERSAQDRSAVSVLETFLRSNGKVNTNFSCDDKWPNSDGTFEFVENPDISRRPKQNFLVQIKGTHVYSETEALVKFSLQNLAFPALIYCGTTLDPGILFVVLNPDQRGSERVFWKYMSVEFIDSIDYDKNSVTINFTPDEEVKNTDESISDFCYKLSDIVNHHSFVKRLDSISYSRDEIERIIEACNTEITESIDRMDIIDTTRDDVSKRILLRLYDLCVGALLINALNGEDGIVSTQLAWEKSLLSIETKYLGAFLKGLQYIGKRVPDDGQSERLMLKYYEFLWEIRKTLREKYGIFILNNLEKFPLHVDQLDHEYYELVANAFSAAEQTPNPLCISRYYVQKKTPFFIGAERYYELTLQLAGAHATKYNRITAYTKLNISTNYSVRIRYEDVVIDLWGANAKIKIITDWEVSIEPSCLNKLSRILQMSTKLSSNYGEYEVLMNFLTETGLNFLNLIDLEESVFASLIDEIYKTANTSIFKGVLQMLRDNYSSASKKKGRNVIRYLLISLKEETIERVLPTQYNNNRLCAELYLSSRCFPFENNPFIFNLVGSKTSENGIFQSITNVAGFEKTEVVRPYLALKNSIKRSGEIYFEVSSIGAEESINLFNASLNQWEYNQGYYINQRNGYAYIESYEYTTISILKTLLRFSSNGNKGQRELNQKFIKENAITFTDSMKEQAIQDVFVDSQLLLIYGAAGTGKTTLINYISNLMAGRRKLFLTKTHTALQNLRRRIDNPGASVDFISMDSFTKKVDLPSYDIIFVDECSAIDNKTMLTFLNKMNPNTFLVLAGDVYQIESIDFGNWFFYAKDIIKTKGANVELLNTWRTKDESLISLWNEVRSREELITEKLAIDGPFSEDIGPNIFMPEEDDEVVLCLNYDGKFGLNNINNYFQSANKQGEAVSWQEWSYKVGDPILFNDTKRFSLLYNNLKGRIVEIEKSESEISFVIDVEAILTEKDCQNDGLGFIDVTDKTTCIRFTVYAYDSEFEENAELDRKKSVLPFQLAYAVSIHKAQGLEYDSVKVIIPSNNSERITHGIFYTAITRAKKKLKIYWSSETMKEIVGSFSAENLVHKSLDIVKERLQQN